ncbi:N-acetylmuramoyl-L-alanine amidase [Saccharomonospora iraqiensis]|uniref:N-acetylmuramoyl-L-alanine amidase n=1 Tax=Saccharomonospora iraqiensis TaxID=52698 RepID=UPI00022E7BD5|nr:N-acetylmuramoyl-L-alanine amidase [Saccharomonospora iraqiensis]
MEIIGRARWGARYPDGFRNAPLPASEVWLHHSVTPAPEWNFADEAAAVRRLEQIGQERFGGGISYTFVVPPSGRVFEGHSVHRQGAHTGGRNDFSRAICLIGNYERRRVSRQQVDAVAALLRHGHARGWWRQARLTGGHRDAPGASTLCPGRYAQARIAEINRSAQEDDMPSSDEVARAVWTHWIYNRRLKRREYSETLLGSSEDRIIRQQIAPLRGEVAAIRNLVEQLVAGGEVDNTAVEEAARRGVRRALDESEAEAEADSVAVERYDAASAYDVPEPTESPESPPPAPPDPSATAGEGDRTTA